MIITKGDVHREATHYFRELVEKAYGELPVEGLFDKVTEPKKTAFVIDVMMSLSLEEITALKRLSDIKKEPVEITARSCMNDKCQEQLNSHDASNDGYVTYDNTGTTPGA